MLRIILSVFIVLSILIFGTDRSSNIMGLTGSVESMQNRGPVPEKHDFNALINVDHTVLQFSLMDRNVLIEASVIPLEGISGPGEYLVALNQKIDRTSHDELQGIAEQILIVVYQSNQLLRYGEPDIAYVKTYNGTAICWELGRITYFFLPYHKTPESDTNQIVVWREKTSWANLWIF
ncbi:MAG TPA: hypothetical protein EYQ20_01490 [candidate division Zixibacteria bacterium]|nr:hypothetical protein [candidate division Zixibacteria bacterium]